LRFQNKFNKAERMKSPDYSSYAKQYAQSRPMYPEALFSYLASLVEQHSLAWDCATGNGQAALALAKHFKRIIATDISAEQIKHAIPHRQIEYRVATSEQSGLDDKSVDLVTVASALHWFDLDSFYAEVQRVVRLGGGLAAWSYHVGYVEPPFDQVFFHFYRDILYDYFAPGARLVDDRYDNITLPGEPMDGGEFFVSAKWNLEQMQGFIKSWSGTQQYIKEKGEDPVALIGDELKQLWGHPENIQSLRWPLFIKISRL
jgi:ubiquinone/menaquinone biosynthesis C-methylase UbiE